MGKRRPRLAAAFVPSAAALVGIAACSIETSGTAPLLTLNGGDASVRAPCTRDDECTNAPPLTEPAGCASVICDLAEGRCRAVARDADGDGHRTRACVGIDEAVAAGDDCDDADPATAPGAWDGPRDNAAPDARPDRCGDGKDNDCNGLADDGRVLAPDEAVSTCACNSSEARACAVGADGGALEGLSSETAGVGACSFGTIICANGVPSGCAGAVGPAEEDCATAADEDCRGAAPECGHHLASVRFGAAGTQDVDDIAVDADGNAIFIGQFDAPFTIGGRALAGVARDAYIVKLNASGAPLWVRQLAGPADQHAYAVQTDATRSLWVVGAFETAIELGSTTMTAASSDSDIFIAKFGLAGANLFAARFGSSGFNRAFDVAVDGERNVIVAGHVTGAVDFGGGALAPAGGYDAFVAKFSPAGAHLWSRRLGGALDQTARAVAVDPAGNVFVAGEFDGTLTFGGTALTSAGRDVFLAKLAPDGSDVWAKRFGDAEEQRARKLATDGEGSVVLVGSFSGTVEFGPRALVSAGSLDGYVAKFDAAGALVFSLPFGDAAEQQGFGVATDRAGAILITGWMSGTASFGGPSLVANGETDAFVARLSPTGAHRWSARFGDARAQIGVSVAADPSGQVWVGGAFTGAADFGGGALVSGGDVDAFAVRLAR